MPYLTLGMAHYPIVPSHEWVGEVYEIEPGVIGFDVGDRVVGECSCGCMRCERCRAGQYNRCAYPIETGVLHRAGAFAEYINFPAIVLHRVSKNVSIESACLVEPAAVAFNGVRLAEVSPRDDIAIFGDGPIGLLLLIMAKAFGAHFVALVGASAERLSVGPKLGADTIIDVRNESVSAGLVREVGVPPSVIIEATGNPASIIEAVNAAAPGARIVLQGIFAGQKLSGLHLDRIVVSEMTIKGTLGSPGVWPDVIRLIETGQVNPGILVTDALELNQYHRAIQQVKDRTGIKTIVRADA